MGNPYDPYGQQQPQQPGYGQPPQQPGYGQQYPPQQPPAYQAHQPPPAYPAQPAFPAAAQPQYGVPQQPYGHAGAAYGAYASWGSRVAAYFVDGIIIGIPTGILYAIAAAVFISSAKTTYDPNTQTYDTSGGGGAALVMLLVFAVAFVGGLYFIYMEGTTGQTIGKKLVNIRLISEQTGQPIGFGNAFIRKIAHALDSFACGIGYLWPAFDAKSQTFADKVMHTVVVRSV